MKKLLVVLAALTLTACAPARDEGELVKTEFLEYEIIEMNRPKHFSVTLRNVKTGDVFNDIGRSKHCNWHNNWKIGDKITVKSRFYKKPDGLVVYAPSDDDVNTIICD